MTTTKPTHTQTKASPFLATSAAILIGNNRKSEKKAPAIHEVFVRRLSSCYRENLRMLIFRRIAQSVGVRDREIEKMPWPENRNRIFINQFVWLNLVICSAFLSSSR